MNLDLAEIRSAVHAFTEALTEGCYALLFFSGHGFESTSGQTFLIPQNAPADYKEEDCLCVQEILEVSTILRLSVTDTDTEQLKLMKLNWIELREFHVNQVKHNNIGINI